MIGEQTTTDAFHALDWMLTSRDTGASSIAILAHMMGFPRPEPGGWSYPSDPADLGRCLRLLERFPHWRARLPEMAALSPEWAALVGHWGSLAGMMEKEVGIRWEKGRKANATYDAMKSVIKRARR